MCNAFFFWSILDLVWVGKNRKIQIYCDRKIKKSTFFSSYFLLALGIDELHQTLVETGIIHYSTWHLFHGVYRQKKL